MSDGAPPAIAEFRSVGKTYGRGAQVVHALRGVDLHVARGEFVSLMGASGSGKSTCLNLLGCLDRPTQGEQRFLGTAIGALARTDVALVRREYLGFVFQSFCLLKGASALENVELPLLYRRIARAERRERALQALAQVGLAERAAHLPNELSGGQQQRVAIARALVARPVLLLADEPTGNLDSENKLEVIGLLRRLNEQHGLSIVMVTHEPEMAAYSSRVLTFRDGRIVAESAGQA